VLGLSRVNKYLTVNEIFIYSNVHYLIINVIVLTLYVQRLRDPFKIERWWRLIYISSRELARNVEIDATSVNGSVVAGVDV